MNISFDKINKIFQRAEKEDRNFLLEYEVYQILKEAGIRTPNFLFLKKGQNIGKKDLDLFKGDHLFLKIVSPLIIHKTDVGGVQTVENNVAAVNQVCSRMLEEVPKRYKNWAKKYEASKKNSELTLKKINEKIRGILLCEKIDYEKTGFGTELLIGLRNSREFGPVITMGIGGVEIEYLNERIKEGKAISVGSAHLLQKKDILGLLKPLAVYDKLVGKFRGKEALITKKELIEAFFRFQQLGAYYSPYESSHPYVIEEAEVNPFVVREKKLIALDAMCRFSKSHQELKKRAFENIKYILKPQSIGIIGVSEKMNVGHIILNNILKNGFPCSKVVVVKPGFKEIEGCACMPTISDIPQTVDLFVLTLTAEQSYDVMKELVEKEKARSAIIIAGGIGEKEGTQALEKNIKALLKRSREEGKFTPVVNGGNCLGIYSKPGKYDTTFIPDYKLYKLPRSKSKKTNLVYISQSGAFMISRMSKLPHIEPLYAVSIGNQIDLTVSDYLNYFKDDDQAKFFGVYIEGFLSSDGLAFARAARNIICQEGKMIVVYKAGRSPEGRVATSSHTASVAGDYSVCRSILEEAGVIIADTIFEFENSVKNISFLAKKNIRGNRVGLMSNAGFESVIMADNLKNSNHEFRLACFSPATKKRISGILKPLGIDRLQDINNPLDVTPVADDAVFAGCVRAILEDNNVDCAVISPVPMTTAMFTLAPGKFHKENLYHPQSIGERLIDIFHETDKPFVVNVDSGEIYDPLVACLEQAGVPTFRRSDSAVKFLRKYINSRLKIHKKYHPILP